MNSTSTIAPSVMMINDFEENNFIVIENYSFHVGQLRGGQWQRRGQ
jgi:hypothetical protein